MLYKCPKCGSTKVIRQPISRPLNSSDKPAYIPCGWQGCDGNCKPQFD